MQIKIIHFHRIWFSPAVFMVAAPFLFSPAAFAGRAGQNSCERDFRENPAYRGVTQEVVDHCNRDHALLEDCLEQASRHFPPGWNLCPTGDNPCTRAHLACHEESRQRWKAFRKSIENR